MHWTGHGMMLSSRSFSNSLVLMEAGKKREGFLSLLLAQMRDR
jgi:hypothetical protein